MGWKKGKIAWLSLLLGLTFLTYPGGAEVPSKLVLVLGDDSYLPPAAVKGWTGAEVKTALDEYELLEFALVILSNIPYNQIPGAVREGLQDFVARGGSLFVSGGPNAYGSGGYGPFASLLPFEIRAQEDWRTVPFKAVIAVQPGHPVLQGVTFQTIGSFNDVNPKPGAAEIAQYAGGKTQSGARFPGPLIGEQQVGQGTVVATTFELGREVRSGWPDGTRFLQNVLTYLAERSPLKPKPKEKKVK